MGSSTENPSGTIPDAWIWHFHSPSTTLRGPRGGPTKAPVGPSGTHAFSIFSHPVQRFVAL
eukprot:7190940-Pyramimonas_sp.AAC.1